MVLVSPDSLQKTEEIVKYVFEKCSFGVVVWLWDTSNLHALCIMGDYALRLFHFPLIDFVYDKSHIFRKQCIMRVMQNKGDGSITHRTF